MKIVWLAPFDVTTLEPELSLARRLVSHSCSWIVNLSTQLAQNPELDMHLVTESPLVARNSIVQKNNITYHVIKSGIPFTNRGFPGYFNAEVLTRYAFNRKRLSAYVRELKPDIIHSYGTENAYSLAALSSGYPFIVSMQGILNHILEADTRLQSRILKQLELELVEQAAYLDCRTNLDADFVRNHNSNAKIFTIHRAIHKAFFDVQWQQNDNLQLLFVGSVLERKGIEVAVEALQEVVTHYPKVTLRIAGSFSDGYRQELMNKVSGSAVEDSLDFLGHCSAAQIATEHARSRMLIFPSFMDNSPNGVAEALVSGLPVIASRVGGIPSMVSDGETGILVSPRNASQLSKAILKLLANPGEAVRLSKNAQEIARKQYHPESVANSVHQAYSNILAERPSARKEKSIVI